MRNEDEDERGDQTAFVAGHPVEYGNPRLLEAGPTR